jgi:hypothetical protein
MTQTEEIRADGLEQIERLIAEARQRRDEYKRNSALAKTVDERAAWLAAFKEADAWTLWLLERLKAWVF